MNSVAAIPLSRPDHPSLDYELLRSEGIRHLENLATELWTDFNAHDPGITLLELMCYAITDLGYRSRTLKIGDLIAGGNRKTFFEAVEILPMAPVTARDYRKLMIDVNGVKNAWIEKYDDPALFKDKNGVDHALLLPEGKTARFKTIAQNTSGAWSINEQPARDFLNDYVKKEKNETDDERQKRLKAKFEILKDWVEKGLTPENMKADPDLAEALLCRFGFIPLAAGQVSKGASGIQPLVLNGLARIVLNLEDHIDPENPIQTQPVVDRVWERLQANRFLCSDFVQPTVIVGRLPIAICLHLEVRPGVDEVAAAAEAIWRIEQHLTPRLRFYTYQEMRAKGLCNDQIVNGPLLDHGFIDDAELDAARLLTEFRHSDLTKAATAQPDVLCVRELKVKIYPNTSFAEQTSYPIYSPPERPLKPVLDLCASCVYVTRNGIRHEISETTLKEALRLRRKLALCIDDPGAPASPQGDPIDNLGQYQSLQYDLPEVYGVGHYGLSDDASPYSKGVRKQLQAYLAFFDQILASYLLQLEQVRDLLAIDQDISASAYLSADLSHVPGMSEIIDPDLMAHFMAESPATRQDRRNRLLDHLLARFGEAFSEYAATLLRADLAAHDDVFHQGFEDYLAAKAQFLRELAGLGAHRGKGYNYRKKPVWNADNVAGVKKRVHRMLGLSGSWHAVSLLTSPPYRLDILTETNAQGSVRYRIAWRELDSDGANLTLLRSNGYVSLQTAQNKRDALYSTIWRKAHYSVIPHPKSAGQFAVAFSTGGNAELVGSPMSEQEAINLLERIHCLLDYAPEKEKEGFHLIEHILLRPNDPADDLLSLPLSCDLAHSPCDPYSNWVTVVLPNWPKKFADPQFRRTFEQGFRMELPTEDAVRFCWVNKEQMRNFEERYSAWLEAKASCTPDECHVTAAANALIDWLNNTQCSCNCHACCKSDTACDDCKDC
ncbi:MAG: hypothetical protein ACK4NS_03115 [Saprospiraceae bacterium]